MARPSKLTKFSIENALAKTGSVTGAAAYSGVDRRTFQRSMTRFNIGFAALNDRYSALFSPNGTHAAEQGQPIDHVGVISKPAESQPEPEKNILRLTAADFTGPCRGEARGEDRSRSADDQLARYRRLKGY